MGRTAGSAPIVTRRLLLADRRSNLTDQQPVAAEVALAAEEIERAMPPFGTRPDVWLDPVALSL